MSVYDYKRNYINISIPRTASTSISRVLGNPPGHAKIDKYYYFLNQYSMGLPKFDEVFKFAFVRHPIDRFVSGYFAQKLKGENISEYILNRDWADNIYFQPQWRFVALPASENLMDFTGKYENLEKDWEHISKVLAVDTPLPHVNKSNKQEYEISKEALGKLNSFYYNDYLMFDYK